MTPIARGSAYALGAACLFGLTAPLLKRYGEGDAAFATAAVLYAGAALGAGALKRGGERPIAARELGRIALVSVFGAALAPTALAWGLTHAGAAAGALLLNLEALFTVLLARVVHREPTGPRVALAVGLMLAGGALLALRAGPLGTVEALGLAAVALATLGWALDNTLSRPLADFDPRAVVFVKAVLGAALSACLALLFGEPWPARGPFVALLLCGVGGYGVSLGLYLRAQRILGAARTGSLFAVAPFVGAALAFALGDRAHAGLVAAAAALFALAVYLHVTERHEHAHRHEPLEHEHAHRHDDGHHDHLHDPPVTGSHSHPHRHAELEHEHPHGSDLHHRHRHEDG
ncbi:MAG TPA: DMT family transporter [Polyangiaceae bacterium]|nr:DMT family transporter [Polyangiaceae bacterium]